MYDTPACGGNLGGVEQLCRNALTVASSHITWLAQAPSLSLVFFNLFLLFWIYFCVPHHHISTMFLSIVFSSFSQIIYGVQPPPPSLNISFSFSYIYFCSPPRAVRLVFLHSFLFLPFSPFPWFTLDTKLVVPARPLCKGSDYPLVQITCKLNTPHGWSGSFALKNWELHPG